MTNPDVDPYFATGCGRCPLGNTPDCKVHRWQKELATLRRIALDCGLKEELKWSHPCYTFQGKNVVMLGAFTDRCTLSFFKGALLRDASDILQKPGENSQAARLIPFTDAQEILELETVLKEYIAEAVEVEKAGLEVKLKTIQEHPIPEELQRVFEERPQAKAAFENLTPGRQRGYLLYFFAPKQTKTRLARIEKSLPRIYEGKGLQD
jgi:uncharacterized protein YdeI (YjbR/CyaY-like superfamily)